MEIWRIGVSEYDDRNKAEIYQTDTPVCDIGKRGETSLVGSYDRVGSQAAKRAEEAARGSPEGEKKKGARRVRARGIEGT